MSKLYWKRIIDDCDTINLTEHEQCVLEQSFRTLMYRADKAGADRLAGSTANLKGITEGLDGHFDFVLMRIKDSDTPFYWSGEFTQAVKEAKIYGYLEKP